VARPSHARAAAGLIGGGFYIVVGWFLVSRLVVGGIGPIDQSAELASSAFTSTHAQAAPPVDRSANELTVLIVSVVDGPAYECRVPAHFTSVDEIMITSQDFASFTRLDCSV
jgi:hypothetical protein